MNYEKLRMSQELQDYIWVNMREKIHAKFKEKESALYKEFLLAFYKEVDVPEEVIENIFKWEGSAERKWRTENNISYTIKLVNMRKNYLPHEDDRHKGIGNYDALVGNYDAFIYDKDKKTKKYTRKNELHLRMDRFAPSEIRPYAVLLLPPDNPKIKEWMSTSDKYWYGSVSNLDFTIDMRNKNDLPPAQKLMLDFFWKEKVLLEEYNKVISGANAIIYSKSAKEIIELIPGSEEVIERYAKIHLSESSLPNIRFKREERIDMIKDYVKTFTKEVQ